MFHEHHNCNTVFSFNCGIYYDEIDVKRKSCVSKVSLCCLCQTSWAGISAHPAFLIKLWGSRTIGRSVFYMLYIPEL